MIGKLKRGHKTILITLRHSWYEPGICSGVVYVKGPEKFKLKGYPQGADTNNVSHLPHLWMDNYGSGMVHVWVKEMFPLRCIIQSGHTNSSQPLVSPVDIAAHPVNGQTFTVIYTFVKNNWTLRSIYFLPFNYISGNRIGLNLYFPCSRDNCNV